MYDVSPKMRKVIEWRYAKRKELRQQYLKEVLNPTRQLMPLDSGIERIATLRIHHQYVVDITFKYHVMGGLCFIGIIALMTWTTKMLKERQEKLYRTGQVSYADREFKFC